MESIGTDLFEIEGVKAMLDLEFIELISQAVTPIN
jgi:hypothetical protein